MDAQHVVGSDGVVTVAVRGEIDMGTVEVLSEALTKAIDVASAPGVVVDMSAVRFCDSSGLRALVDAHRAAQRQNTLLRVGRVSEQVRLVLEITELFTVLTGRSTPDRASPQDGT